MIREGDAPDWICVLRTSTIFVIVKSGKLEQIHAVTLSNSRSLSLSTIDVPLNSRAILLLRTSLFDQLSED